MPEKIISSCGCVFCDLGYAQVVFLGVKKHKIMRDNKVLYVACRRNTGVKNAKS